MNGFFVLMLSALVGLAGCAPPVQSPVQTGELVVVTRSNPLSYYQGSGGSAAGFEHDLVEAFAAAQGWSVRWVDKPTLEAVYRTLEQNEANLGAAALARLPVRQAGLLAGPTLYKTHLQVVGAPGMRVIKSLSQLQRRRVAVQPGTGHAEALARLLPQYPGLRWDMRRDKLPEALLEKLQAREIDAAVLNALDYDLARHFYPDLTPPLSVPGDVEIVWALPRRVDPQLQQRLAAFLSRAEAQGLVSRLYERYFGHVKRLGGQDVSGILDKRLGLLPRYRPLFQQAQDDTGLDWRLLAAIAYQESQWNPLATSPTGVRGMMMLTAETADRMKVANRLDARESILGGARYLLKIRDALPTRIPEPDRTLLALAAYNQGYGHVEDARRLTQFRGGNPDSWADVKRTFPLLARGGHPARVVRHGYTRGGEAVIFVESIRNYRDILMRFEPAWAPYLFDARLRRMVPARPGSLQESGLAPATPG
jgi:membrane-bound lytic murein transglycosylase F